MTELIDSLIHWAHWINWDAVGRTAFVFWVVVLLAVEIYLLDRHLERNIQEGRDV